MNDNPTNNKDHLNPDQPAGLQVGQELNGKMEFPPNFGQQNERDITLEDLDDDNPAPKLEREKQKQPNLRPNTQEESHNRNLDNHSAPKDAEGLDSPEGLG
jgi:hypothetical protein